MCGISPEFWNTYNGAIATLIAGVVGPLIAFQLEALRRRDEANNMVFTKLNRCIGVVIEQWNIAKHLKDNVVEPTRGQIDAWLNMHAVYPGTISISSLDNEAVALLIDYKESTLFQELNHAERSLRFVLKNIEIFSAILLNEVTPRLKNAGILLNEEIPESQIISIVGEDLVHRQRQLVTAITADLDKVEALLISLPERIREVLLREFPEKEPMSVTFPNK